MSSRGSVMTCSLRCGAGDGVAAAVAGPPSSRIASNRDWVYGCCGSAKMDRAGPVSTIRPFCMTGTRSHRSATTPKLCVTMSTPCAVVLQVAQQVEDLGLHGDVQGGGRLVGDDQVGLAGDRAGDQDALGHAAGDLVRVGRERPLRVGDADPGEQGQGPLVGLGLGDAQGDRHRLDELAADRERRVEVGHRLLRDVRDAPPADLDHLRSRTRAARSVPSKKMVPPVTCPPRGQQAEHRERGLRLARPGLADQAVHLALADCSDTPWTTSIVVPSGWS